MQRSIDRILTTHTGSLPRPPALLQALQRERGEQPAGLIESSVAGVVQAQVDAGISVVNDGEMSKISYATYVAARLDGFGGQSAPRPRSLEDRDFPEYVESRRARGSPTVFPACVAPLVYRTLDPVRVDIANIQSAIAEYAVADAFLTAASPGVIAHFLENQHYRSHEDYLFALADAMKLEYEEIHRSGLVLQLDCPDLTAIWKQEGFDRAARLRQVALHIEVLNHATRDIPPDAMRLHLCWGNYEGPHTHDVPLREIVGLVFGARPAAYSFEGANPRHEHEWVLFEEIALPDGKVLIPGVIDSTTNYVEHPELVAQRIVRYANLVGRENVIAGTDCGFATFAASPLVHPTIVWPKLRAMTDGAALASEQLW